MAYVVGNVASFSSTSTQTHWIAVKRIMRYLNGTPDFGLLYLANDNMAYSQMQIELEIMMTENQHLDLFL